MKQRCGELTGQESTTKEKRNRLVEVTGLPMRVRVQHNHLTTRDRVEESAQSDETFELCFRVHYSCIKSDTGGSPVFNYAAIVTTVRNWGTIELSGPIEVLADKVLGLILEAAIEQKIALKDIEVTVVRPQLAGLDIRVSLQWLPDPQPNGNRPSILRKTAGMASPPAFAGQ